MLLRLAFLALSVLPFFASAAAAQQYAEPTWADLVRTLVRMKAIDVTDTVIMDEFGIATECDLYDTFYHDDFKWNRVRQAMMKSIKQNIAAYHTRYRHDIDMQLDRYDFSTRLFMFKEKSKLKNDNHVQLFALPAHSCHMPDVKNVPYDFALILHPPLFLEGIPLPEADARNLVMRMERDKNYDRIIYARFNVKILYVEPLRKRTMTNGETIYKQGDKTFMLANLDATVESIDFYEDSKHTRLIYHMDL